MAPTKAGVHLRRTARPRNDRRIQADPRASIPLSVGLLLSPLDDRLLLPRLFLSSAYYYDKYPALGIGPPPPGCCCVHYGTDLLLVDVRTGLIRDVLSGAFV